MKKLFLIVFSLFLAVFTSTSAYADFPDEILIMLREFWPGVDEGTKTVGATAVGNYFNADGDNLGTVILMWDSDGENIEACGYTTNLIAAKVILQSHNRRDRLVLRVPVENDVVAQWFYDYDDPEFNGESRILLGYEEFLNPDTQIALCGSDGNDRATIAEIVSLTGEFIMEKRWWGTWGDGRYISEAAVTDAYLDHSPNIFPAIIATLMLERYF